MPEQIAAGVIVAALILYALSGGADFGGGVLELSASGPRGPALKALIGRAIGPIWEANHVWLILVIVVMFVCFPPAFAAIMTALHIPLLVMLVGIVLRGSALVLRNYDDPAMVGRYSLVFGLSSLLTPWALGVTLGAMASGALRLDSQTMKVQTDFVSVWLAPFPVVTGLFVVTMFTMLAAVYLTVEADDPALRRDMARRGLAAGVGTGVFAFLALFLARSGAPHLWAWLVHSPLALPFQVFTGCAAVGAMLCLHRERWLLARALAIVQVTCIALGWAAAQWPLVLPPDLSLHAAAAPRAVIVPILWALGAGAMLLFPALGWLYRVFGKRLV